MASPYKGRAGAYGGRVNPTGARHNGVDPSGFLNAAANFSGAMGAVGSNIGRSIGSAVGGVGRAISSQAAKVNAPSGVKNATTTYGALGKVLGKKR